ncbi:hypothetical protein ACS0TY_007695 [Phlomoides rotata]
MYCTAKEEKKKSIKLGRISLAVKNDAELSKLFEDDSILWSGGGPKIHETLLP